MENENVYEGMSKAKSCEIVANGVGLGFSLGTVVGFGYHLVKEFHNNKYGNALRLACRKAPWVGCKGAALLAAFSTIIIADSSITEMYHQLFTQHSSFRALPWPPSTEKVEFDLHHDPPSDSEPPPPSASLG